jgi:hypothetical protein
MLVNEDPVDPPAIEDSESEQASKLADNIIPMQLILLMKYSRASDPSHSESCEISNTQALRLLCWSDDIPNRREPCEWHLLAAATSAIK